MIVTMCLAMATAQCDAATADKPCCDAWGCRPVGTGCADGWTDCGAKCTVAFSQQEQRRCADGGYARLIGYSCDACPEDARATTDEEDKERKGLSAEAIGAIVGGSIGGVVLLAVSYAVCRARGGRGDSTIALLDPEKD
ncbi:MAG: hypothetical protein CL678_11180 [Bdellovibrionaceae bacterium]|nr:hypothetical protein [Pseudobdellovibrionaceae bacterium]